METEYELITKALELDNNEKYEEAYELWKLLADEFNNTTAYFFLGSYYQFGLFVEMDYKKAKDYYFLGAKENDADCLCNIGYCFEFGIGVKKSKKKAYEYYKKASKLGNESATYNLANCYIKGDGIAKNIDMAIKCLNKIADDFPLAALRLGIMYSDGYYILPDIKLAIKYFKIGAQFDNAECYYNLSCLVKNDEEAVSYLKKSADLGYSKAMSDLGFHYQMGIGVEKDDFESYDWFCRSADLLDPLGAMNKAICLREGIGVEKNEKESFDIFLTYSKLGFEDAIYNVGLAYEQGRGVRKSLSKALYYYNLVDSVEADVKKARIYRERKKYDKALAIFMQRCEESIEACYYLAYMFKNGEGTDVNIEEAIYYFKKVIENDDNSAYPGLVECYLILNDEDEAIKYLNEAIKKGNVDCIIAKFKLDRYNNIPNYINILLENIDLDDEIKLELAIEYYLTNKLDLAKNLFLELKKNGILKASYYLALMEEDKNKKIELLLEAKEYVLLAINYINDLKKAKNYAKKAILNDDYLGYVLYLCLNYESLNNSNEKILKNISLDNLYEIIENDYDELSMFVKGILKYYGLTTDEDLALASSLFKNALKMSDDLKKFILKSKYFYKFSLTIKDK